MTRISDLFRGAVEDLRVRPRGNVPTLDVLRTVAILAVFNMHYAGEFEGATWVQKLPPVLWGWAGVDLFFVLSGFLIGTQLWKEANRTGHIRIGRFLLRRGLRIWPLYFGFVILAALSPLFMVQKAPLWPDVFFLSNSFFARIAGGWSLSTEEQFYILAPVSIALALLFFKPRKLWFLPLSGVLLLLINRAVVIHYSTLPVYDLRQKLYYPIATHADGLAVGLLIAWAGVFSPGFFRSRWSRIIAGLMVVVGLGLYAINSVLFNFTTLGLVFGAAELWGLSLVKTPKVLDWSGFYLISRLSYGMYLNHFWVLALLRSPLLGLRQRGGEPAFWALYFVCLLISIAAAFLTFQLIEWPFLEIRSRWMASEKAKEAREQAPAVAETAMAESTGA
jgi:peptidoglycan/LPS O-acetylase OafA/YrhL